MTQKIMRQQLVEAMHNTFILSTQSIDNEQQQTMELALKLVEVSDLKACGQFESYTIVFHGPPAPILPQHIYSLQHQNIGIKELFLVPIGADKQCCMYEAVINRQKGSC